jgi:hypothetical protein
VSETSVFEVQSQDLFSAGPLLFPYHIGGKVNYTFTPGYPAVRLHAIKFFAEAGGFNILLDMFRQEQFVWPGGDTLLTLLRCFSIPEVRHFSSPSVQFHPCFSVD